MNKLTYLSIFDIRVAELIDSNITEGTEIDSKGNTHSRGTSCISL